MRSWVFIAVVLTSACAAEAGNQVSLGPSKDTVILPSGSDPCVQTLFYNHDSSFENGFCWQAAGVVPGTTYGAFGEAFLGGSGGVECIVLWVTQVGNYNGQPLDVYAWEGGITSPPGLVTGVTTGVQLQNVPYWPSFGENSIVTSGFAGPEFTVGYWADFSTENCGWYIGADLDGFGGYPWTNIAPGIGYPTGWHHPAIVWGSAQSLGLGVYVRDIYSPVEGATWGAMRRLFSR